MPGFVFLHVASANKKKTPSFGGNHLSEALHDRADTNVVSVDAFIHVTRPLMFVLVKLVLTLSANDHSIGVNTCNTFTTYLSNAGFLQKRRLMRIPFGILAIIYPL